VRVAIATVPVSSSITITARWGASPVTDWTAASSTASTIPVPPGVTPTSVSLPLVPPDHLDGQFHATDVCSIKAFDGIMGVLFLAILHKEKSSRLSCVFKLRHEKIVNFSDLFKHVPQFLLWGGQRIVPDDDLSRWIIRSTRHSSRWTLAFRCALPSSQIPTLPSFQPSKQSVVDHVQ
jgi:hypothetical protein